MALMHDYARPQHQASFVKFFVFTLFVRGYFFQLYCLGNYAKRYNITISKRGLVPMLV